MKKILLIYPGEKTILPRFPVSVLALASYLRKNGFESEILDTRIENYIGKDYSKYLFIGISSQSGEQLSSAIEVAKYIKRNFKDIILVLGGVHVSFFPEQSIKSNLVDIVVRFEGEVPLLSIASALIEKKSIYNISGTTVIKEGKIINNPEPPLIDMENLDVPAYDLIDYNKYSDSIEYFNYESSRGCPHRCKFCYVHSFHNRKWREKSVKKTLDEIEFLWKKYKFKKFEFLEDNFFVDRKRVRGICKGLIERNIKIKWTSLCRADYLAKENDDFFQLLKNSGCDNLGIGVESGSQRMLDTIYKDITLEQIITSTKKCVAFGIMPVMSFMIGIPGETKKDIYQTIDFYKKLMKISKNIEINGIFIYAPYPGTPIYDIAVKAGYKPYTCLEDWTKWRYNDIRNSSPWLSKSRRKEVEIISIIARFKYFVHRLEYYSKEYKQKKLKTKFNLFIYSLTIPILGFLADLRWKRHFFRFAIEWKIFEKVRDRFFKIR